MINALCRQDLHPFLQLPVTFLPEGCRSPVKCRKIHFIQNGFHRQITGQIPAEGISFLSLPDVAEQTMKNFMEIEAVHLYFPVHKGRKEPVRCKIQKFTVTAQRPAAGIRLETQGGKCRVQITQREIELISAVFQDIFCDGELLFLFFLQFMDGIFPFLFFQSSNTFLWTFVGL